MIRSQENLPHRPGRLRFCNAACHDGYKTDREYGVCYGPVIIDNQVRSWQAIAELGLCVYCSAHVPTNTELREEVAA